ncbi:MAG: CoA transferase [Chloroflexi bacterium]|nr:CoA transferase [Chloroflexota bacterium]
MAGPLTGIRVLDFTWALAGPYGSMILTDLGAEVLKVERVGQSEEERGPGPYVQDFSTYFFSINRGKQSIAIDLKSPQGREAIYAMVRRVDVVIENFTPGTMDRLGLGYETLRQINPGLVYASCSGFGQWGPYAQKGAFDVIVQAMGGLMSITGEPGGPPLRAGASVGDILGGTFTALGVLAALVERARSGQGQYLDASMLEAQVALLENAVVRHSATGAVPGPIGTRHPLITPFQAFPTADGYIVVAGVRDWVHFCTVLGRDDLAFDERFQTNPLRTQHHAALEPELTTTFRTKTTQEWIALLESTGAALTGPVNTVDKLFADPHLKERGTIVELPLPGDREGMLKVSNHPVKYSRTPTQVDRPAPELGEHTERILREVAGLSDEAIAELERQGTIEQHRSGKERRRGGQSVFG